jgi:hypothetical protein
LVKVGEENLAKAPLRTGETRRAQAYLIGRNFPRRALTEALHASRYAWSASVPEKPQYDLLIIKVVL